MAAAIERLTERRAWKALAAHYQKIRDLHHRGLFADDPSRGERMTVDAVGLFLDYSKNRVTDETLELLVQLAEGTGLRKRIDAMFRGERINITKSGTSIGRRRTGGLRSRAGAMKLTEQS